MVYNYLQTNYDHSKIIIITNQLNLITMTTLYPSEIAKQHLSNLGLQDLTSFTAPQRTEFWAMVNAEYQSQFDNHTT